MAVRSVDPRLRVLYLAAIDARDVLPRGLRALECDVRVVPLYRSVSDGAGADALRDRLTEGGLDAVIFASASAVRGYADIVGDELARSVPAVSIGPVTSAAIEEAGIFLGAESEEASVAGLVEATRRYVLGSAR